MRVAWLALGLGLWACDDGNSATAPEGGSDGQPVDARLVDSGAATRDTGGLGADAATPPADLGLPIVDAQPPEPDAGPGPVVVGAPVQATPERLLVGAVDALAVARTGLVVEQAAGLVVLEGPTALPLGPDLHGLTGAASFEDELVVAVDGALFVREGAHLVRSPLSDRLPGIQDVAAVGSALWIATLDGIFRFTNGQLQAITPQDLPAADARLVADGDGLWVATEDATYRLAGTPLSALPTEGAPAGAVAVDGGGDIWRLADDQLWWLDETALWWPVALPFTPRLAAAGLGSPGVWLATEADLWHLRSGELQLYEGAPTAALLAVDAEGGALAAGAAGLWRVPLGRLVQIEPPPDLLLRPGEARVVPSLPERVTAMTATVDGTAVAVAPDGRIALAPQALTRGSHRLQAVVTWDDGVRADATVAFASQVTTWVDDVEPIFTQHCSMCHGQGAAARPLWASEHWRSQMDRILDAVRTGRMPLARGRVPDADIELLEVWREGEMPEEWP